MFVFFFFFLHYERQLQPAIQLLFSSQSICSNSCIRHPFILSYVHLFIQLLPVHHQYFTHCRHRPDDQLLVFISYLQCNIHKHLSFCFLQACRMSCLSKLQEQNCNCSQFHFTDNPNIGYCVTADQSTGKVIICCQLLLHVHSLIHLLIIPSFLQSFSFVKNYLLDKENMSYGVPQGFVLGPLLFLPFLRMIQTYYMQTKV